MADLAATWRGDLAWAPGGDLLTADKGDLTRHRIVRRLLTAVRGYIWHLEYGAGLPQKIGHVGTTTTIESLIRANIALEASVATYPIPQIKVTASTSNYGLFVIAITYMDATLGEQVMLSFDTTGQTLPSNLLLG